MVRRRSWCSLGFIPPHFTPSPAFRALILIAWLALNAISADWTVIVALVNPALSANWSLHVIASLVISITVKSRFDFSCRTSSVISFGLSSRISPA